MSSSGCSGPLGITAGDRPVPLPGAAERALLALLLLSPGRMVTASTLIDRLWDEATCRRTRRTRCSCGCRSCGGRWRGRMRSWSGTVSGYRADVAADAVDVEAFVAGVRAARARRDSPGGRDVSADSEAAALFGAALDRWGGEPLADFAGQSWAMVEAARLSQLRLAALTERAQLLLSLGRPGDVLADLDPVVSQDPTQETLAGLLMTALYQSGRQADALEVFARTRAVLDDELGLEPSAALRATASEGPRAGREPEPGRARAADWPTCAPSGTRVAADATRAAGRAAVERAAAGPRSHRSRARARSLRDLLATSRLVSLVGPGGAGKTATGYAAAAGLVDQYRDGVWVVRLASVTDPEHVPLAAAEALGAPLDGAAVGGPARQRLLTFLSHRELLLVLDNCEHVVDAAARLVDDVLSQCPNVTVLATTREALGVPGEVQVPLGPLADPAGRHAGGAGARLSGGAAVRRASPRGAPDAGPDQRRRPRGGRGGRRRAGRDAAGRRAGGGPGVHAGAGRARGAADRPVRAAHLRRPDRGCAAAHPARDRRLEPRPAHRPRAGRVPPARGVPRRLDPGCRGDGRGRGRRAADRCARRCCRGWSTGTWSPSTTCTPGSRPGTGCSRRCASTPSRSLPPTARPSRSRPRTSRTSAR